MVKKTSEKVKNRKSEAPENMSVENDRFTHFLTRKGFTNKAPPMDYFLRLKEMILYKT